VRAVSLRLFVGVPVDAGLRRQLAAALSTLSALDTAARLKPVPPANYHLTLQFIGAFDPQRQGELHRAVDAAAVGQAAQRLALDRIAAFPSAARPVAVAALPGDPAPVLGLQRAVRAALGAVGLAPDHDRYRPHVTLARLRGRGALALEAIDFGPGELPIDRVCLFESLGTPQGVRYPVRYERLLDDASAD
jgi:2'-5' RNA ligase